MKFLKTVSLILLGTATTKIWSAFGESPLLQEMEPLLGQSFRSLLLVAAMLELIVAVICLFRPNIEGLFAVALISTVFLAYRTGLWWVGFEKPCSCLGDLTDALLISPQLADNIMKCVLAIMLIGSVSQLVLQRRKAGFLTPGRASSTPAAAN